MMHWEICAEVDPSSWVLIPINCKMEFEWAGLWEQIINQRLSSKLIVNKRDMDWVEWIVSTNVWVAVRDYNEVLKIIDICDRISFFFIPTVTLRKIFLIFPRYSSLSSWINLLMTRGEGTTNLGSRTAQNFLNSKFSENRNGTTPVQKHL